MSVRKHLEDHVAMLARMGKGQDRMLLYNGGGTSGIAKAKRTTPKRQTAKKKSVANRKELGARSPRPLCGSNRRMQFLRVPLARIIRVLLTW